MRPPVTALPSDLEQIPDYPAVFLLWADQGEPYLARTTLLRRRLTRLLASPDRLSRMLRLGGVVQRIEYWHTGSQLESMLTHLELAQKHFPKDWAKITRLKPPAFAKLATDNPFPRMMVTTRLGRGVFVGPFASRASAERYENEVLDLFQLRRCEENLAPSREHPGCIYGEMNRCARPCQQVVSQDEYRHEAARVEAFLRTSGASLLEPVETARDEASATMQFEEAERLHQRYSRIQEVAGLAGELARPLDQLMGIAVVPSAGVNVVTLVFFAGGRWCGVKSLFLGESSGVVLSMDRRLREIAAELLPQQGTAPTGPPIAEHMAVLARWHGASWRDGEWIGFDSVAKIPYRKLVNAVGRVAAGGRAQ
jgi:excinuclease UvrABC nuclease subunit